MAGALAALFSPPRHLHARTEIGIDTTQACSSWDACICCLCRHYLASAKYPYWGHAFPKEAWPHAFTAALFAFVFLPLCEISCFQRGNDTDRTSWRRNGAEQAGAEQRLLILGDSLTAGYGLSEAEAFPALIEEQFTTAGHAVTVLNAGISGDTTAGGRSRVAWTLQQHPTHVLVALGGNDGLRGFPPQATEANLRAIITAYQQAGCQVC